MKHQRLMRAALIGLSAVALSFSQALATTFYVDGTNGNDSNAGTTWAAAKKTIQAAVNVAMNGDAINIAGGAAADLVYDERVLISDKTITLTGGQDNTSTAGNESNYLSIIRPSSAGATYTEATLLSWSGFPSTTFEPVLYGRFSTNTYSLNVYNLTIDGNDLATGTRLYVGIAVKNGNGTIGSSSMPVHVTKVRESSMSSYNGCFGIMIFGKSQSLIQYTRIDNYQTAGILVAGNSTSTLASTIANQPRPEIENCIIEGTDRNNTSSYISGVMSVYGGRGYLRKTLLYRNHNNSTYTAGAERNSYGYGVYLSDARNWTVGDLTVKGQGNVITENEIGVFAEITVAPTVISPSLYQIRQNNIYHNGYGVASNLSSTGSYYNLCGCSYTNTTIGNVRYRNSGTTSSSSLSVQSNAWGNSDVAMFSKSTPAYTPAAYDATEVTFWQETTGDVISVGSALVSDTISYDQSYTYLSGSTINYEYGYSQFPSLNDAVAAASASSAQTITIPVGVVTLNEPLIITKKVTLQGAASCTGTPSGSMATLRLASGVCGPTIWVQGMSTTAGDPITRTPDGVEIRDLYITTRNGGSLAANFNWGIAFTGAFNSNNTNLTTSPTNTKVKGVKMDAGFVDGPGGLFAMVTDVDPNGVYGVLSTCARVSKGATPSNRDIDAKITYVGDCDVTSMAAADVYDDADEPTAIARIIYDNTVYVATCAELQAALDLAASDPVANTPMNIIVIADITSCTANYNVDGGGNVVINTQGAADVTFTNNYPLNVNSNSSNTGMFTGNEGTYPGGTSSSCNLVIAPSAAVTVGRVNVWPPACLQTAVNLVTAGNANSVYAASGNNSTSPLSFVESSDTLKIAKNFDFYGVDNVMTASDDATFTGRFSLLPETDLNGGVGVHVVSGTITSTRGSAFADGSDQVSLRTNTAPTNSGPTTTIDMAIQFINVSSGSRGLLLDPLVSWNQSPTISKRLHIHGTGGRDAVFNGANVMTLNGSGDCSAPSLIENISIATILVNSDGDCLQTALGTGANQATEGVGTNSTNGSGGTINLNNVAAWTQDLDVGKSVTFSNQGLGNSTSGEVNMRRGASITGLANFTSTINLNQNASWVGAANPNPSNAIPVVSTFGIMNIAGYGHGTAVGTGSDAGGPWNFSNVDITKPLAVLGHYYYACANDQTNCVADTITPAPGLNSARSSASETVVGFSNSTVISGTPIFLVGSSNVTIAGFYFDNISSSAMDLYVISSNASAYNDVTIGNNILEITGAADYHGFLDLRTAQARTNWTVSCNRMFGAGNVHHNHSYRSHFVEWNNNASSSGASSIANNVVLTNDDNDQIAIRNMAGGLVIEHNFFASYSGTMIPGYTGIVLIQTAANQISGITVRENVIKGRGQGIIVELFDHATPAINTNITNNFITGCHHGLYLMNFSNYTAISPNHLRINNNYINGNSAHGIFNDGIGAGTTGKVDVSLNWWGGSANLGPTRGLNVSAAVQPFASANGDVIAQDAVGAGDVFTTTLPFYISSIDQNSTDCGWTGGPIIGPVLRMTTGGTSLLGVYNTITDARDNANCVSGFTCNPTRTNTDEIWVIGGSGSGAYPSVTSPEPAYPVLFNADPQPSTVLGINGAVIRHTNTGAIQTTTRTNGFAVKNLTFNDYGTAVTAVWLNSGNATVNGNTFNSVADIYTAIRVDGGGSNALEIGSAAAGTGNTINYTSLAPTASTGIHVSGGFTGGTIHRNTISGIAASSTLADDGAGIYIGPGNSGLSIGASGMGNTIDGNSSGYSNGIVLDATASTIAVNSNLIAQTTSLASSGSGFTSGGFGILAYASDGTSNIGNLHISGNTIGSASGTSSVGQSGIFIGGTSGNIGMVDIEIDNNTIRGVRDAVTGGGSSDAAISIATLGAAPASGGIHIYSNTLGGTTAGESNKTDIQIGASGTSANNLVVNVYYNAFRSNTQLIESNDAFVKDYRTNAGANIRNIFGNTNSTTFAGLATAGNGNSGFNTFSHAAILTSSTNLQNYSLATVRTADAVSLGGGYTAIYRLAQTPLTAATNTNNTTELRENAGINIGTAGLYYNETLTFPDCRCMLLGPTTSGVDVMTNADQHANIYAGSASVDIISTGRENKDIRGGITLHAIGGTSGAVGATGIYGRIPTGGDNKGDVYLQAAASGADMGYVRFAYELTVFGLQFEKTGSGVESTGSNNIGNRDIAPGIIKAGLEDANDDDYTNTSSQHRRTGVFTRGNGTQFTKPVEGPITGIVTGISPNPASGDATLHYSVAASGEVSIGIYNALGIKVSDYARGLQSSGVYTLELSTGDLPAGSYTVRITNSVPGFSEAMTTNVPLRLVR